MAEPARCSDRALAAEEPLHATASRLRHWLLVEQPGRWGHDALVESGLPLEVGERLAIEGLRHGVRTLLIKRRDRPSPTRRRCFAAFTGRRERRMVTFEVDRPEDLLALDVGRLVDARWRGLGEPFEGPLFAVCTHGKHDPCCALLGSPITRVLVDRDDVWEATHIGGDRFAGNILAFPHGLYFGRVAADAARGVVERYAEGTISLEHYRGRSAFPPAVQAAEQHLRVALDLAGVDDLTLVRHERGEPVHRVAFRTPGGEVREVEIEEILLDERLLTCKAARPHRAHGFVLRGMA